MSQHCTNCGHELREGDKFCSECGTPVGGEPATSVQYEYCEIVFEPSAGSKYGWGVFSGNYSYFGAVAASSSGRYTVARSPEFLVGERATPGANQAALDDLIKKLSSEDWELLPNKGNYWYQYRFRRPVRR